MKYLNLEIPPFILERRLLVEFSGEDKKKNVKISGVEVDGIPATFVKSITVGKKGQLDTEPFEVKVVSS